MSTDLPKSWMCWPLSNDNFKSSHFFALFNFILTYVTESHKIALAGFKLGILQPQPCKLLGLYVHAGSYSFLNTS